MVGGHDVTVLNLDYCGIYKILYICHRAEKQQEQNMDFAICNINNTLQIQKVKVVRKHNTAQCVVAALYSKLRKYQYLNNFFPLCFLFLWRAEMCWNAQALMRCRRDEAKKAVAGSFKNLEDMWGGS